MGGRRASDDSRQGRETEGGRERKVEPREGEEDRGEGPGTRGGQREAEDGGVLGRGEDHHTLLIDSWGQVMEHDGE